MLKVLLVFFSILAYTGGCDMTGSVANLQNTENQKGVEEKIFKHAQDNFSLSRNDVTLKEITSRDLPAGVRYYYLEKKGSYGNNYYNYFVHNGNLFCSKTEGDFARLLKDLDFLSKKNLSTAQFWTFFQTLEFKYKDAMLIDEKLIGKPFEIMKPVLNQLAAPKLDYKESGATFTFGILDTENKIVRNYTVNVSPEYKVSVDHADLKAG
jgi:hypothetical protein